MPDMKWYAIHTFSGQENNIKKRIEQMIEREGVQEKFGRILLPTREVVSTVRGHRHVSVQNAMPTYVFIAVIVMYPSRTQCPLTFSSKWCWTSSPSIW